jgi:hypothetical protein
MAKGVMPRISSVPSGPRLMTQMANCDHDQVVYRDCDRGASAAPIESADVKHPLPRSPQAATWQGCLGQTDAGLVTIGELDAGRLKHEVATGQTTAIDNEVGLVRLTTVFVCAGFARSSCASVAVTELGESACG